MTDTLSLPDPGEHRYWEIKHQPQKKATPLRLELREHTHKDGVRHVESWTRLIGYDDTVALPSKVAESAEKILEVAGRVDEFVGMHHNKRRIEESA